MGAAKVLLAVFLCLVVAHYGVESKAVFAHFMMGNTYGYDQAAFQNDMNVAKSLGIDAFALNIGADEWTWDRLYKAYQAAIAVNFKVFISFDMNYYSQPWDIVNWIRNFAVYSSQYTYNGKVFVSTFGGEFVYLGNNTINNGWQYIKDICRSNYNVQVYFAPDWSGLNGNTVYQQNPVMDAFLSWNAWPSPSENAASLQGIDNLYMNTRGSKQYIAPIAPYFYTHLSYKNYVYKTETLWIDRWQTLLQTKPDFIEILTWNDWGESHYIGKIDTNQGDWPAGSAGYVNGMDHTAFQAILPAFITAYKNGANTPAITSDVVIYWHRPTLLGGINCNDGIGTPKVYNRDTSNSGQNPTQVMGNQIYVVALLTSGGASINVKNNNSPSNSYTYNNLGAGVTVINSAVATTAGQFTVTFTRGSTTRSATDAVSIGASGGCNYNVYANRVI